MFNIFKKLFGIRCDNPESNINLVNKTFILKKDYLNPFVDYYIYVIEVKNDWVLYNYVFKSTGICTSSPQYSQIKIFLGVFSEIKKPFDIK